MRTKLLIGLLVAVFAAGYPSLCAQSQSQDKSAMSHPLEKLEITAAKVDGGKISFVVRNGATSALKIVEDSLPWNTTSALRLLIVPMTKGAAAVEAVQPIEDPRATILEISASTELRGELDVTRLFPRWKELVKRDVLLVWSLNLYDVETGQDRRFNGVIEYRAK